jgi:glutamate 5-kinase
MAPPAAVSAGERRGIVVLKIGTSSVMRERGGSNSSDLSVSSAAARNLPAGEGELALSTLALVADTLVALRRAGHPVVLVTSGAVGVGCRELGVRKRPNAGEDAGAADKARVMARIQAYAAVGQSVLMGIYGDMLKVAGVSCAQVLLTSQDLGSEYQYENAKNTLRELLDMGVLPIVNENDTVATEELKYGDNDWMSALVSTAVGAEWLFLLTDVDRLYSANPHTCENAVGIDVVEDVEELDVDSSGTPVHGGTGAGAKQPGTQWGTGGMATKITAARLATAAGVRVALVHGRHPERVLDFVHGAARRVGTVFEPKTGRLVEQREQWISQALPPRGDVWLSANAVNELRSGVAGAVFTTCVVRVKGVWTRNSAVRVCADDGTEIGRGICCYGSGELDQFKGMSAATMTRLLGTPTNTVAIHTQDLALFTSIKGDGVSAAANAGAAASAVASFSVQASAVKH